MGLKNKKKLKKTRIFMSNSVAFMNEDSNVSNIEDSFGTASNTMINTLIENSIEAPFSKEPW